MRKRSLIKYGMMLAPIVMPRVKEYLNKKKLRKDYEKGQQNKIKS
ncbi:hypothetical protein JOC78_002261 [Bacillus ectoiniformans]|nr:hypothetical protein [Bacillus ectoiniformans]MBM7649308.1 hypothetical protein [Bacillus ectoiniformans]